MNEKLKQILIEWFDLPDQALRDQSTCQQALEKPILELIQSDQEDKFNLENQRPRLYSIMDIVGG